jgi:hypothetical protein
MLMPKVKLKVESIELQHLVSIKEAYQILGEGFSRSSILRRIESGEWVEGKHWVDDRRSGGQRRLIKINLTEVQKCRTVAAGKR